MVRCKICGKTAVYREMPKSEDYPTITACERVKLLWEYYCQKHIPPITTGRIGGCVGSKSLSEVRDGLRWK